MSVCMACGGEAQDAGAAAILVPRGGCVACGAIPYILCNECAATVFHGPAAKRQEILLQVELTLLSAGGTA